MYTQIIGGLDLSERVLVPVDRFCALIQAELERNILEAAIKDRGSYELTKVLDSIKEAHKLSAGIADDLTKSAGDSDAE